MTVWWGGGDITIQLKLRPQTKARLSTNKTDGVQRHSVYYSHENTH